MRTTGLSASRGGGTTRRDRHRRDRNGGGRGCVEAPPIGEGMSSVSLSGPPPLDASAVTRASVSFDQLAVHGDAVLWVQRRPGQGATQLVRWRDRTGPRRVTPVDLDVGSSVHAYGGGSYAISARG